MPKSDYTFLSCRQKRRRIHRETETIKNDYTASVQRKMMHQNECAFSAISETESNILLKSDVTSPINSPNSANSVAAFNCGSSTPNEKNFSIENDVDPGSNSDPVRFCNIQNTAEFPLGIDLNNTENLIRDFSASLKSWAAKFNISQLALSNLLQILRTVDSLLTLPSDARSLMKTPRNTGAKITSGNGGESIYFGFASSLIRSVKENYEAYPRDIKIDLNIDGLPLTKSSGSQFWPILASIVDNFYTEPFIVSIYHGFNKPHSSNDFLQSFVEEATSVFENGITVNDQNINVSPNAIICDAPAKAFITGVKGHTGYFGCSKCEQEGDFVDNRVIFPEVNSRLRTDTSFRVRTQPEHHKYFSMLENLNIGMVSQIPLDYMHLVCIGVTKKITQLWVKGPMNIRLKVDQLKLASECLIKMKASITNEFARKPRSLDDIDRWKATELRQFLLYTGPVVMKNILPQEYYEHFMALSVAIRILADEKLHIKWNAYAQSLLVWFVDNFSALYCEKYLSYNVHNLTHLAADVQRFGPLDTFSAFKYENHMQKIKQKIKLSGKPLQQLVNRLHEKNTEPIIVQQRRIIPVIQHKNNSNIVKFQGFCLSRKEKDKYFMLKDGVLMEFMDAFTENNSVLIKCKKVFCKPFFKKPCDSKVLGIGVLIKSENEHSICDVHIDHTSIDSKCLSLSLGDDAKVILPFIHKH